MRPGVTQDQADALRSVLGWWELAGVDVTVDDVPRQWLRAPQMPAPTPASAPVEVGPAALPATLDALADWLASPEILPELGSIRVAPSGSTQGGLMLLTDMPDKEDMSSGALLSGSAGRLLEGMLRAMGLDRASVYLAPVAPGRPAAGKMSESLEKELGRIARYHIALARPRAVLMLGDATTRAVSGMGLAPARGTIHDINVDGGNVPAVATFHPRFLLQHPSLKADAWSDLRMLMEILTT